MAEPFFPWTDALSVHVEEIDGQHQHLIDMVNAVYEAVVAHDHEQVREVIAEMVSYTRFHFTVEENLLLVVGYPEQEEHQDIHQDLLAQIEALSERVQSGGDLEINLDLMRVLKDWLVDHILEEDHKYRSFFESAPDRLGVHSASWARTPA